MQTVASDKYHSSNRVYFYLSLYNYVIVNEMMMQQNKQHKLHKMSVPSLLMLFPPSRSDVTSFFVLSQCF